jgi:hypothetical protein
MKMVGKLTHTLLAGGNVVKYPSRYDNRIRFVTLRRTPFVLPLKSGRRAFTSSGKKERETLHEKASFFTNVLAWYSTKLDTHPLLTKGISSGLIAGSGDFLCQLFVDRRNAVQEDEKDGVVSKKGERESSSLLASWDPARTGRFALLGAFLVAPGIHYWYNALSMRLVPGAVTVSNVMKRVALDQFAFTPFFLQMWLSALWTLEGETPLDTIPSRMMEATPTILVANWILWIPAQIFNFRMVPVKYQVLYSNIIALWWNIYLSSTATTAPSSNTNCPPRQEQTNTEILPALAQRTV